ncbi:MAG: DUF4294 domain-containing protein [Bacteroidota bacterium]
MNKSLLFCFIFYSAIQYCFAQDSVVPVRVPAKVINGDTLAVLEINAATIVPNATQLFNASEITKYQRLIYNVRKVYPYAKLAATQMQKFKSVLDTIHTERKRKAYIKKAQKELEAKFGNELKNLSFNQGKILLKLVYRETGNSTFDIVKELRGGFNAFVWQTMARLFGYDLKNAYDPEGEDQAIEKIVVMIEHGS